MRFRRASSRRWSRPRVPAPRRCSATCGCARSCSACRVITSTTTRSRCSQTTRSTPYAQTRELAIESVAPLGADYVAKYKQFVSGGRVDVYETEGKRSGAYMAGVYGVGPYLLMNYNDTLRCRVHTGARGGSRHAHGAVVRKPAVRDRQLHDLRRRGGLDHQRALPARSHAGEDARSEGALPAVAACRRFDRRHLLHAGPVRRLRAARASPGRAGPAGHDGCTQRALCRAAQGVLGRRLDGRRLLQVHLGAHTAFLPHALLRLPVRDLLRLVGASCSTR